MDNALHSPNENIKINGRIITGLKFAGDIDGLAGSEEELVYLSKNKSLEASTFGMEMNPTKTTLLLNDNTCNPHITIQNEQIEIVNHFKYLGSIIDEQGFKKEILAIAAQENQV